MRGDGEDRVLRGSTVSGGRGGGRECSAVVGLTLSVATELEAVDPAIWLIACEGAAMVWFLGMGKKVRNL